MAARVTAGKQAMQQRSREDEERKVMELPPGLGADAATQREADMNHDGAIRREDSQADRHRAIGRQKGNQYVERVELHDAVAEQRQGVRGGERERDGRKPTMNLHAARARDQAIGSPGRVSCFTP